MLLSFIHQLFLPVMISTSSLQLLTTARLQLHYAIQPIAAVGAALAVPQPDGSQASLYWDAQLQSFVGNLIQAQQAFRVGLDPVNLVLRVLDGQGGTIAELPLDGKTLTAAMDWLKEAIAPLGADTSQIQLLSYPPDDFPDAPIAHGAPFDAADADARVALADYYAISNALLQGIATRTAASAVYIWPHHFDMATLIDRSVQADGSRTIGVGLSPGDTSYPEPYWYVSPYPYPAIADLPDLAGIGVWHTHHWVGAVLTASALHQTGLESNRIDQLQRFLNHAIEILW